MHVHEQHIISIFFCESFLVISVRPNKKSSLSFETQQSTKILNDEKHTYAL
jgi:hypothetical protein